eukprot:TRINITY_DN48824_c0_g1_i1.p3 TRINITY_DN48824_c0_g1~~TRINITY_DN48824_c0_g1_i1.p3  ORF type:complete len:128 (-),score=18.57 TRINITY_DN48824_c0_g1_i1:308-691(-)
MADHSHGRGVTVFERCVDRCRTSSKSIAGGNRYGSDIRHCYGAKQVQREGKQKPARRGARRGQGCIMWRQTGACGEGSREPENDLLCNAVVGNGMSGYCECDSDKFNVGCTHAAFKCDDKCAELQKG